MRTPAGRYGTPARGRGRMLAAAVVALLLVAGVVFVWRVSRPPVSAAVVGFRTSADAVTVDFEVRAPRGRSADCVVRARDRTGAEVGRATVRVGPGRGDAAAVRTSYRLFTRARAVTGELAGCHLVRSP